MSDDTPFTFPADDEFEIKPRPPYVIPGHELEQETPEEDDGPATFEKAKAVAIEIIETLALAALIWLVLNAATARYVVEGRSMQPNLQTGQYFIVSRMAYWFDEPERGDVIVFDYPNNPENDYVKRVIGLPGETIRIDAQGNVFINNEPIDEPYLTSTSSNAQGSWTVPEDSYFVMGDNRAASSDSRSWGTLEDHFIIGKAWISYWPLDLWGLAPHYDYINDAP